MEDRGGLNHRDGENKASRVGRLHVTGTQAAFTLKKTCHPGPIDHTKDNLGISLLIDFLAFRLGLIDWIVGFDKLIMLLLIE